MAWPGFGIGERLRDGERAHTRAERRRAKRFAEQRLPMLAAMRIAAETPDEDLDTLDTALDEAEDTYWAKDAEKAGKKTLAILQDLIAEEKAENPVCTSCEGRGYTARSVVHRSNPNLDTWEHDPCAACEGTGEAPARQRRFLGIGTRATPSQGLPLKRTWG